MLAAAMLQDDGDEGVEELEHPSFSSGSLARRATGDFAALHHVAFHAPGKHGASMHAINDISNHTPARALWDSLCR